MPGPTTLLSATTGLSGLTGGTSPAGADKGDAGNQSPDFMTVLSGQASFAAVRKQPPQLSATDSGDTQDTPDAASAGAVPSGKALPLAALAAAVLPVPVTLSALVDAPKDATDSAATPEQTAGKTAHDATACMPDAATQGAALAAIAQTLPPAIPAGGASATTAPALPSAAPTIQVHARGPVRATSVENGPVMALAPLPHPGFTLLPDGGSPEDPMAAASLADAASAAAAPAPQPAADASAPVTLSGQTAIAMGRQVMQTPMPGGLQGEQAQAGVALLTPASGAAGAVAVQPATATIAPDPAVTLKDASYLPAASTRPGFTLIAAASADTAGTGEAGAATTPQLAQVAAAQAAPGLTVQPVADDNPTVPVPRVKLASARGDAVQGASARNPASAPTRGGGEDATTPAPSSASRPGDGAGTLDSAFDPVPVQASAGTAATAQTLAASGGVTTGPMLLASATASPPPQGNADMAALVDRLVEARAAARSGLGAQSTMASIAHVDFGRVSLRFDQDDAGMSISMSSSDPGFAPAAQAALAQSPAMGAAAQGHGAGQSGSGQNTGQQPGQQWAQAGGQTGFPGGAPSGGHGQNGHGQNSGQGQNGGQGWQGGQNGAAQHQRNPALRAQANATSSAGATDTGARRRGGILA